MRSWPPSPRMPASCSCAGIRREEYYGIRFMGVNVMDPATGAVMPGFPHLFPASIALGYGVAGLLGATNTVAVWAILGALAVFFAGARVMGRWAAFLGCLLLILNVAETWYARYPNTEVVMQTLLFAGLLAFSYSEEGDGRFFAGVDRPRVCAADVPAIRVRAGTWRTLRRMRAAMDRRSPRAATRLRRPRRRGFRARALLLRRPAEGVLLHVQGEHAVTSDGPRGGGRRAWPRGRGGNSAALACAAAQDPPAAGTRRAACGPCRLRAVLPRVCRPPGGI